MVPPPFLSSPFPKKHVAKFDKNRKQGQEKAPITTRAPKTPSHAPRGTSSRPASSSSPSPSTAAPPGSRASRGRRCSRARAPGRRCRVPRRATFLRRPVSRPPPLFLWLLLFPGGGGADRSVVGIGIGIAAPVSGIRRRAGIPAPPSRPRRGSACIVAGWRRCCRWR